MIEKELKPLEEDLSWSKEVQKMIEDAVFDAVYLPLLVLVQEAVNERQNSRGDLKKALQTGRITWSQGYFRGTFSASISKTLRQIGATWDGHKKQFSMDWAKVPEDIRLAAAQGVAKSLEIRNKVEKKLNDLTDERSRALGFIDIGSSYQKIYSTLNGEFKKTLAPSIAVSPDLTQSVSDAIRDNYIDNVDFYTEQWTKEAVHRLKLKVKEEVLAGFRADRFVDIIKAETGVSQRKARFIARQETSNMVSAFREARYKEAGVNRYRWGSSHDSRVRPRHRELSGHIFSWDSPPIVDTATGRRAHPGNDFGCRCVAIPILRTRGEE